MNIFGDLGLSPSTEEKKQHALDLMNSLTIKLGIYLGELMGNRDEFPKEYDHQFEVMRRFLAVFLAQLDDEYNSQAEELRKILFKK